MFEQPNSPLMDALIQDRGVCSADGPQRGRFWSWGASSETGHHQIGGRFFLCPSTEGRGPATKPLPGLPLGEIPQETRTGGTGRERGRRVWRNRTAESEAWMRKAGPDRQAPGVQIFSRDRAAHSGGFPRQHLWGKDPRLS